jgi:hypothetical protein
VARNWALSFARRSVWNKNERINCALCADKRLRHAEASALLHALGKVQAQDRFVCPLQTWNWFQQHTSTILSAHWSPSELDSIATDSNHYLPNTTLGETAGLLKVNTGGTHSNHCVSEGERLCYKFLNYIGRLRLWRLLLKQKYCIIVTARGHTINTNFIYIFSPYRAVNTPSRL